MVKRAKAICVKKIPGGILYNKNKEMGWRRNGLAKKWAGEEMGWRASALDRKTCWIGRAL
jgi:hypothetical protein